MGKLSDGGGCLMGEALCWGRLSDGGGSLMAEAV